MAENIRSLIYKYLKEYKPDYWLFEGPLKEAYSDRSGQVVVQRAPGKARANDFTVLNRLRYSFGIHLPVRGRDRGYWEASGLRLFDQNRSETTSLLATGSQRLNPKLEFRKSDQLLMICEKNNHPQNRGNYDAYTFQNGCIGVMA